MSINNLRLRIFYENLLYIEKMNSEQSSYVLGETQFMDLTKEEFTETYLGVLPQDSIQVDENLVFDDVKDEVNWTKEGAVNEPPNQGSCGSCWAFATTAVVEGYTFLKKGNLPELSQQQLVDCATWTYGNLGCQGGNIYPTLGYVISNGMTTLEQYPYIASQTKCLISKGEYKIDARSNNSGC
jgi:cathepsin L